MSLADIPDVLIAHLTSYLNHSDICNLMKTSKKNYNAIKGYKKDKIYSKFMRFTERNDIVQCVASDKEYEDEYIFKSNIEGKDIVESIASILNECLYVEDMNFYRMRVTSGILKLLNITKTKIGSISIVHGFVDSGPEELVTFYHKFGTCNFKYTDFKDKLWTDEARSTQNLHLNFIVSMHRAIEVLVQELQKHCNKAGSYLRMDIGIFLSSQFAAANRYFNPETGELNDLYQITVLRDSPRQSHYRIFGNNVCLYFGVLKF